MKAVVMAGGEGSRLRPLTTNRPKPLVPVCNRPIMEHILNLLRQHDFKEVIATVHYLADEIQGYFGVGTDFGIKIRYSHETSPLGTAGSVKRAEKLLGREPFVIVSGDALTDCDLSQAIAFHKEKKSVATLILYRVPNPLEFGVVITDSDGRVTRFLEKPSWSEVFSDTVNTGMYILEPEVLDMMEQDQNYDWSSDIFPRLLAEGKPLYGYIMDGYWCDVGSLQQYRDAQEHLLSGRVALPIGEDLSEDRGAGLFIGPYCAIDESATLVPPVCLGRNVRVKAGARVGPYSVIGDNAVIEENAIIERSVAWENVYIGHSAAIHSAIIGSRAIIKRDSVVREDAVIGDRTLLEPAVTVRPRVKIWPDKVIERGSTVSMSLVWGNKWASNLFRELGVAGLSNIEMTPEFVSRLGAAAGSQFPPGSKIITSRDSTRSSRMVKRAMIAALLSAGCNVLDLHSAPPAIARHFIRTSNAAGAVHMRKLPDNRRVTLIEFFDARGLYLSRNAERKIESAFFREDYRRVDPDSLGSIDFAGRAVEEYQSDFFRLLGDPQRGLRKMRIACDFGFSPLAGYVPTMFAKLGVEVMALNAFNESKLAPRSEEEIRDHVDKLKNIVSTLKLDLGVLFVEDGERLIVIDGNGQILDGSLLFAALATLQIRIKPGSAIALPITAPERLEKYLIEQGGTVIRTKNDVRSLLTSSLEADVDLASDNRRGFIFPALHAGFDGAFAAAKLVSALQVTNLSLVDLTNELPNFPVAYETVAVPWESKGLVMRRLAEEAVEGSHVELVDGIKISGPDSWVLVLPDAVEPLVHVYAESESEGESRVLASDLARRISEMHTP